MVMNLNGENDNFVCVKGNKALRGNEKFSSNLKSHYFHEPDSCTFEKKRLKLNSCIINNKNTLRLDGSFFGQPCIALAKNLLGKILVRKLPCGKILKGTIVETESYLGITDMASHSFNWKRTDRNEAMYQSPGTAYVYSIYGVYYCFNISSLEDGSAVLIRALEPLEGLSAMKEFRSKRRKNMSEIKQRELCNGPSKLCQAFKIEKDIFNKVDLCLSNNLWLEQGKQIEFSSIISCKRIGIDSYGEEWASKLLRFYVLGNSHVSRRCKITEKALEEVPSKKNQKN